MWDYLLGAKAKKKQARLKLTPPTEKLVPTDYFPQGNDLPEDIKTEASQIGTTVERQPLEPLPQNPFENNVPSPLEAAENRVRLLRDYENNPVKNNDRGWKGRLWDVAREAVIGAGGAYNQGLRAGLSPKEALAGSLGGALAGGLYGGFQPTADEERQRAFEIRQGEEDLNRIRLSEDWRAKNEILKQKPYIEQQKIDTTRFKAEADAEYKDNQIKLGTQKANELKIYRDAIIELKERGADQNDSRIKLLEQTLEERKRSNIEREKDRDLDRDARVTVAKILSQNRIDVANINQSNANFRTQATISANQAKFAELSRQKQEALQRGDKKAAEEIDVKIANAKIKAKAANMTDDEINQIFGGQ